MNSNHLFLKRYECIQAMLPKTPHGFDLLIVIKTLIVFSLAAVFCGCSKSENQEVAYKEKSASRSDKDVGWSLDSIIVINPRLSIDRLRSGMTVRDVISELGQPTRTNAAGLEFSHFGLFICPGKNITLFPPSSGQTAEGIRIGSGRTDLIKVYGVPTATKTTGYGFEILKYQSIGITFQLHDDKVDWIDVHNVAQ